MGQKRAFTLVELLVVIAIIAVLLAILLPALASVKEKGKRMQCGFNLSGINKAIGLYCDDNGGKLLYQKGRDPSVPDTFANVEKHPYMAYCDSYFVPGTTKLMAMKLGCLYSTGLIGNPKTFYCPACTVDDYKWESYSDPLPWEKLPKVYVSASGNQMVRTGYTWRPMAKSYDKLAGVYDYAYMLKDINYNKPWMTDTVWSRNTLSHIAGNRGQAKGIYAAFPDGHVNFCSSPAIFDDKFWGADGDAQLRGESREYSQMVELMEP